MRQPLFSITTPCFNSASTIERTLKSVLGQSYKDYEYIIVDGGSTDGTLGIIKHYEPLFEGKMHWKSEPDKGLYDAFNKGIERSNGTYCWNINSDDYMEPDALSKLAQKIEGFDKNDLPVIVGAMNVLQDDGILLYCAKPTQEEIKTIYKKDFMIPHPSTVIPKEVYQRYGTYDTRFNICADKDWFHRVFSQGIKIQTAPELTLSNFVKGGTSTNSSYQKNAIDHWLFLSKKYPFVPTRVWRFIRWTISFEKKKIKDWKIRK